MQFSSTQVKVTVLFLEIPCRHVLLWLHLLTYDIYWLLLFWKSNYFEDGLHIFSLTFFPYLYFRGTLGCFVCVWRILSLEVSISSTAISIQKTYFLLHVRKEQIQFKYLPSGLLHETNTRRLISLSSVCLYSFIDPLSPSDSMELLISQKIPDLHLFSHH